MIQLRPGGDRGLTSTSWLRSYHSFSFNNYHDARHMRFGPLRVLNDDYVDGGGGFPMHPHRDMEILTWIVDGVLEHRDSSGGQGVIGKGELQRMTAGKGVYHSEYNQSKTDPLRLLQIWIMPSQTDLDPSYEQVAIDPVQWSNHLLEIASGPQGGGILRINQDARIFIASLDAGVALRHDLAAGRAAYLFVIDGRHTVDAHTLSTGDAVTLEQEPALDILATEAGSVMLFDVPL